jgi:hypothetical protein
MEYWRMKRSAAVVAAICLCTNVTNGFAGEVDLSFNSDAFRFIYVHDLASNDLAWDGGFLSNSDNGYVAHTSLYLTGVASDGASPLEGALGGRVAFVNGDNSSQTGVPLALGGYIKFTFASMNRLSIRGDAYYAPDVLTAQDLETYQDYTVRIGYNVLQDADIYIGARYVKGKFENGSSAEFDNSANIGVSIKF